MSKIAIVFWSGTGNTEAMANAIADGAKGKGAEVEIFSPADFSADSIENFDVIAFGCPAMGAEILEEDEFQPMWDSVKNNLSGKKIALFGSYDWGDGEWMRTWEEEAVSLGAVMAADALIVNNTPDDEGIAKCNDLGSSIA